jgi:hypothetical protein
MLLMLSKNHEINGRLYLQACHLFVDGVLPNTHEHFLHHVFSAMHKLQAVDYHLGNYHDTQEKRRAQALERFKSDPSNTEEELTLIFELEAFLLQVKSSLDMLVKLLLPVIGSGFVRTQTFGDKGDSVVKGLAQYRKKKSTNTAAVDALLSLITRHKSNWLEVTVKLRDQLTHAEGLRNYYFRPHIKGGVVVDAIAPRLLEQETLEIMKIVRRSNLEFHQDFMAFTLWLKLGPPFQLAREDPAVLSQLEPQDVWRYVVWGWRFIPPDSQPSDHGA